MKLNHIIIVFCLLVMSMLGCSLEGKVEYTFEDGNCESSQAGQAYFKQTAEWLAIQQIFNSSSSDTIYRDLTYFPQGLVDRIETRLAKVFDLDDLPERDSVIQFYNIFSYDIIDSYKKILLKADPKEPWVENLLNGQIPTGNPTFDEVYLTFDFEVDGTSFSNHVIFLKSNKEALFNVYKVVEQIKESPHSTGIEIISPGVPISETLRVQLEISEEEDYFFTFKHGWGDCPRGCQYARYWTFKVGENCEVEFLGSYGQKVPG